MIDSAAFALAWKLALLVVGIVWLGLAFWVYKDARRRIDDGLLVATATALGLVPFVGPAIYSLFRPPEMLADVRLRDAELAVLEARLAAGAASCPVCRTGIEPEFLVCPVCTTRLKLPCEGCGAALEALWQACPWCATPAGATVVQVDLDTALTKEATASKRRSSRAADARTPAA